MVKSDIEQYFICVAQCSHLKYILFRGLAVIKAKKSKIGLSSIFHLINSRGFIRVFYFLHVSRFSVEDQASAVSKHHGSTGGHAAASCSSPTEGRASGDHAPKIIIRVVEQATSASNNASSPTEAITGHGVQVAQEDGVVNARVPVVDAEAHPPVVVGAHIQKKGPSSSAGGATQFCEVVHSVTLSPVIKIVIVVFPKRRFVRMELPSKIGHTSVKCRR
jgi:hypothetical protein